MLDAGARNATVAKNGLCVCRCAWDQSRIGLHHQLVGDAEIGDPFGARPCELDLGLHRFEAEGIDHLDVVLEAQASRVLA
jgi:hypothetical protein